MDYSLSWGTCTSFKIFVAVLINLIVIVNMALSVRFAFVCNGVCSLLSESKIICPHRKLLENQLQPICIYVMMSNGDTLACKQR